jgi:hypothetical protein
LHGLAVKTGSVQGLPHLIGNRHQELHDPLSAQVVDAVGGARRVVGEVGELD